MAMRWPDPFPGDVGWATLAATYAKWIGRGVAFSLAALRQAFAAGRDLSRARQRADRRRGVRDAPDRGDQGRGAREHAARARRGAASGPRPTASTTVPAIWVDGRVLAGERAIPA